MSGKQEDIVNQKMALQTMDIPAQANLIWCTLAHKRRKIGPESGVLSSDPPNGWPSGWAMPRI